MKLLGILMIGLVLTEIISALLSPKNMSYACSLWVLLFILFTGIALLLN